MGLKEDALAYHSRSPKGKIETGLTKECKNQADITLAYSPGVAAPCKEIARDPALVYEYTGKGNLVGVITNGSAVLGLGNIGPEAGKPVMEGKAVLFKIFADLDCFDIELNATTPQEMIEACRMLAPTFGGINLEDIKAPECFEVEARLKEILDIPVMHDDQHGTAIVCVAAFLNACEVTKRDVSKTKCVFVGAGAACLSAAAMFIKIGVDPANLLMTDTEGVLYKGREVGMNPYKEKFVRDTPHRTLTDAIVGADVFVGLSAAKVLSQEMVKTMAKDPIIFAMANPNPEILPEEALQVRPDAILATGRSDYPNQVNNVLGYPYIFRGALDCQARCINEEMKLAAAYAIAALAKEDVPEVVTKSYNSIAQFGREYLIPKPFDPRLLIRVSSAVAKAAIESGVARKHLNLDEYTNSLEHRLGAVRSFMLDIKRSVLETNHQTGTLLRIALPEGSSPKILKAAEILRTERICEPILLGNNEKIKKEIEDNHIKNLKEILVIDPFTSEKSEYYSSKLLEKRARKGMTRMEASELVQGNNHYYASMMVELKDADGFCSGVHHNYDDTLRPALQVLGMKQDMLLAGVYMLVWKQQTIFIADATVNISPSAEQLARIAIQTHDLAKLYVQDPIRVAMLSFSNFGSIRHPDAERMRDATNLVKSLRPEIEIDGEMQVDFALSEELLTHTYGFSSLKGPANVLICPDLTSGNIAYKLLSKLGGATAIGPLLTGMSKPVNVLARNSDIDEIVNLVTMTVHRAQNGL